VLIMKAVRKRVSRLLKRGRDAARKMMKKVGF
jgi:hypothetical protein